MDWSKVKNIIILFLISINIFLIIVMGITTFQENYIPGEVLDAAVKVMKNDGFICDKAILPDTYKKATVLKAEFYSASELSEIFFGDQVPFRTKKNTLIAEDENALLSVSSNHFTFETSEKAVPASEIRLRFALGKAGIDMKHATYDKSTGYFYMMHRNSNLFNMYLRAQLDKNGRLCAVTAQWPKEIKISSQKRISFCDKAASLDKYFKAGGDVKKIELGYELKASSNGKFVFEPSWRITVEEEMQIIPAL